MAILGLAAEAASAAASCRPVPGLAGVEEYCEQIPLAGGSRPLGAVPAQAGAQPNVRRATRAILTGTAAPGAAATGASGAAGGSSSSRAGRDPAGRGARGADGSSSGLGARVGAGAGAANPSVWDSLTSGLGALGAGTVLVLALCAAGLGAAGLARVLRRR